MRFVKVQYDAYNRQFKMADSEQTIQLDDGGLYLIADFSDHDFQSAELDQLEANHNPA
jgi:hypothetical protein